VVHAIDGGEERGTLVRVVGPAAGAVAALRLAEAFGGPPAPDTSRLSDTLAALAVPAIDDRALDAPLAFVTTGTYPELLGNLQYKVMEGMLRPLPPVWDVLHLAHGPYQQAVEGRATFLALTRPDAPREDELLDRFATMLDPGRHALVRLAATSPAPLAI